MTRNEFIKKAKEYGYTDEEIKDFIKFFDKFERETGKPVPDYFYELDERICIYTTE
jgi:hypothetical protein